jgi:hypothetical protein
MTSSEKPGQSELRPFPAATAAGLTVKEQTSSMQQANVKEPQPSAAPAPARPQKPGTSSLGTTVLALLGGFALGAAAGYFLSPAPPLEETRFLNFDAESTPQGYLVAGWSGAEVNPDGDSYRWCESATVRLKVRNRGDGERVMRVRFFPFLYPNGPTQSVSVLVNEQFVARHEMAAGPRVATFRVPAKFWRKGDNEIRFKFKYAESPNAKAPPSQDMRTLSAGFDWIEIFSP